MSHSMETGVAEQAPNVVSGVNPELDYQYEAPLFELAAGRQRHIEGLRQQIATITEKAKFELSALEQPDYQPEKQAGAISVRQEGDGLLYHDASGAEKKLTKGELLTDGEWGIRYHLDQSVPVETRRQYILESAQQQIRDLSNHILLLHETARPNQDDGKQSAYQGRLEEIESGQETLGHQVEQSVHNFFRKVAIDFDLPFDVFDANVIQDVEEKVDFVLHHKNKYRGVGVKTKENVAGDMAVQFTVNTDRIVLENKMHQLEKVRQQTGQHPFEDIALVHMDQRQFGSFQHRWEGSKTPGGPDKLWHGGIKEELLRRTLKKFLSPDEIEVLVQRVAYKKVA